MDIIAYVSDLAEIAKTIWSYRATLLFDKWSHGLVGFGGAALGKRLFGKIRRTRDSKYLYTLASVGAGFLAWELGAQEYLPKELCITSVSQKFDGVYDWLSGFGGGSIYVKYAKWKESRMKFKSNGKINGLENIITKSFSTTS